MGDDNEICFCIDTDLDLNSTVVTIENVHLMLECHFEDDTHYPGYYRPCEKARNDLKTKARELEEQGVVFLNDHLVGECDYDGYYALVQRDPTDTTKGKLYRKIIH